ncbi:hypothetical protein D2T29_19780 [Sinirhodobacter populi]|uniref:Uncharacterized protein n=1 Tax=Paenirhodobacter populi TaxID=2306993 RepID=A0A443K228_9RHOB|nr:hypothetical protein [Sinirhodobacter populi]RWR26820.1 hypothetical protein D2T29_19780 [Sinirhodobacter populi]
MARKTLVEQIDEIQFSDAALDLGKQLSRHSATDEKGCVVLAAAALLIAGQFPGRTRATADGVARLCGEFGELVIRMHSELEAARGRQDAPQPPLRVVGGTDVGGAA